MSVYPVHGVDEPLSMSAFGKPLGRASFSHNQADSQGVLGHNPRTSAGLCTLFIWMATDFVSPFYSKLLYFFPPPTPGPHECVSGEAVISIPFLPLLMASVFLRRRMRFLEFFDLELTPLTDRVCTSLHRSLPLPGDNMSLIICTLALQFTLNIYLH